MIYVYILLLSVALAIYLQSRQSDDTDTQDQFWQSNLGLEFTAGPDPSPNAFLPRVTVSSTQNNNMRFTGNRFDTTSNEFRTYDVSGTVFINGAKYEGNGTFDVPFTVEKVESANGSHVTLTYDRDNTWIIESGQNLNELHKANQYELQDTDIVSYVVQINNAFYSSVHPINHGLKKTSEQINKMRVSTD